MVNNELRQWSADQGADAQELPPMELDAKNIREQELAQVMARVAARNAHEHALELALYPFQQGARGQERARVIPRPEPAMANFGMRIRAGDVDGDERPDLAEGAPSRGSASGHATFCRSGRRGPLRCRPLPSAGSSSGLRPTARAIENNNVSMGGRPSTRFAPNTSSTIVSMETVSK